MPRKKNNQLNMRDELHSFVKQNDIVGYIDHSMAAALQRLPVLDDQPNRLAMMLFRLSALVSYDHETMVQRPLGLSSAGFHLLWIIWLTEPIESSAAAYLMGVSRANMTGISTTLIKDGLLRKDPSTSDRRAHLMSLTSAGAKRLEEAWLGVSKRSRSMMRGMSEQEVDTLLELLGKFAGLAAENLHTRS